MTLCVIGWSRNDSHRSVAIGFNINIKKDPRKGRVSFIFINHPRDFPQIKLLIARA